MPLIATIVAAVMLFGCFIDGLPYAYFQLLRWVVCGVCIYRAILAGKAGQKVWLGIFVVGGILFNPIAPIYLKREQWLWIDGAMVLVMLASMRPGPLSQRIDRST